MNIEALRSSVDPIETFNSQSEPKVSSFLYFEKEEPRPFGEEPLKKGDWLYSNKESELKSAFLELVLREMLFEDYYNGDAVPSLQNDSYSKVLLRLEEAAKEGAFEGFHGGLLTIICLKETILATLPFPEFIKKMDGIFADSKLNLHVVYYPTYSSLTKLSPIEDASLKKRL